MTYSIVAWDPRSGEIGAAVQSHWFAAGIVCWAEAGAGAVATQAMAELSYGPLGLERMRGGTSPEEALRALTAADEGAEHRQVAMVDAGGRVAAHTGSKCLREAGHRIGDGFSCQANMMLRDTVWDAMHDAFDSASGDLADRLLAALDAAEGEGGDVRGRQAARIVVVRGVPSERPWEDTIVDLRIDDHPAPLTEIRRLLGLKRAYDRLEAAEKLELAGDLDGALVQQQAALAAVPDVPEIAFWTALSLAGRAQVEEARRTIALAYAAHPGWVELLRRLVADGFVEMPADALAALLPADGRSDAGPA
jgi:uncharacterized Ntn-hydrolase superfamily protein